MVLKMTRDGARTEERMQVMELLRGDAIHARDLVSLALREQDAQRNRGRAPPLLLPRAGCIVMALGQVKAIIQPESIILFDPQQRPVRQWLDGFAEVLKTDWDGGAFEMVAIEEALRSLCASYRRRVCLYRPMVDTLLAGGHDLSEAEAGLHRVVLLKDSLSDFELEVSDLMALLTSLLNSDQDMLALLLTARKEKGEELSPEMHDEVELLLENYHRQLSVCLNDVMSMQRHVQSKQDFMAISLDVHRNRMARMNVHLGIGALSIGICTTIAGYFGMNVPVPQELLWFGSPFVTITVSSILLAGAAHAYCASYFQGYGVRRRAQLRYGEIQALQSALQDMPRLDFALKSAEDKPELSRQDFQKALNEVTPRRHVTELEVDLLFRCLDRSGDGTLQAWEFHLDAPSSNR